MSPIPIPITVIWLFSLFYAAAAQTPLKCPAPVHFSAIANGVLKDHYFHTHAKTVVECAQKCFSSQFCYSASFTPVAGKDEHTCLLSYQKRFMCMLNALRTEYPDNSKPTLIECISCPEGAQKGGTGQPKGSTPAGETIGTETTTINFASEITIEPNETVSSEAVTTPSTGLNITVATGEPTLPSGSSSSEATGTVPTGYPGLPPLRTTGGGLQGSTGATLSTEIPFGSVIPPLPGGVTTSESPKALVGINFPTGKPASGATVSGSSLAPNIPEGTTAAVGLPKVSGIPSIGPGEAETTESSSSSGSTESEAILPEGSSTVAAATVPVRSGSTAGPPGLGSSTTAGPPNPFGQSRSSQIVPEATSTAFPLGTVGPIGIATSTAAGPINPFGPGISTNVAGPTSTAAAVLIGIATSTAGPPGLLIPGGGSPSGIATSTAANLGPPGIGTSTAGQPVVLIPGGVPLRIATSTVANLGPPGITEKGPVATSIGSSLELTGTTARTVEGDGGNIPAVGTTGGSLPGQQSTESGYGGVPPLRSSTAVPLPIPSESGQKSSTFPLGSTSAPVATSQQVPTSTVQLGIITAQPQATSTAKGIAFPTGNAIPLPTVPSGLGLDGSSSTESEIHEIVAGSADTSAAAAVSTRMVVVTGLPPSAFLTLTVPNANELKPSRESRRRRVIRQSSHKRSLFEVESNQTTAAGPPGLSSVGSLSTSAAGLLGGTTIGAASRSTPPSLSVSPTSIQIGVSTNVNIIGTTEEIGETATVVPFGSLPPTGLPISFPPVPNINVKTTTTSVEKGIPTVSLSGASEPSATQSSSAPGLNEKSTAAQSTPAGSTSQLLVTQSSTLVSSTAAAVATIAGGGQSSTPITTTLSGTSIGAIGGQSTPASSGISSSPELPTTAPACNQPLKLLSEPEKTILLKNLQTNGWSLKGPDALTKTFEFRNFNEAFGFLSRIALKAAAIGHYPDWHNNDNRVVVTLTTKEPNGLTTADMELANFMEEVASMNKLSAPLARAIRFPRLRAL